MKSIISARVQWKQPWPDAQSTFGDAFRDVLKRTLANSFDRTVLWLCGAMAELMGLNSQLVNVPALAVSRLQANDAALAR